MRTIKKILVIFMLVVLAASIASAAIPAKNTAKAVTKLGSNASLNKSNVTGENVTKISTKIIAKPTVNASVNQSLNTVNAKLPTKNPAKAIIKPGLNTSVNQSNVTEVLPTKTIVTSGSNVRVNQSNALVASAVGENLALYKRANQSSLYDGNQMYNASKGIDGLLVTFFHTDNESNPWWQVDLGRSYPLSEAIIYNRQDGVQDRARTLMVLLSNDSINWKLVYDNRKDNSGMVFGLKGDPLHIYLKGKQARFVRLQLQEKNWFHLAEVEIYGATNLSRPMAPRPT